MDREAIDQQLTLGKEAAKRGDDALAFKHLHRVVEAEPENEEAWLWLSAVALNNDDKKLCLENVLVLNPDSEAARRGLARLAAAKVEAPQPSGEFVPRPVPPNTPAAAILYPERRREGWRWYDPVTLRQTEIAGYVQQSAFDDIWQGDDELCAYCAALIGADDNRCPGCGRKLAATAFRYPKVSSDLLIYWVLILGIGQMSLATVLLNLLSHGSPASMAWQATVFLSLMAIVSGLALRRFWAYVGSLVVLLLILASMLLGPWLGPAVDNSLSGLAGRDFFVQVSGTPYALLMGPASDLLRILQYMAAPLALLYGIFRVGPDFERVGERLSARLDRDISDASHFHGAGAEYGRQGMWASAVLHFQRAAALEPSNPFHQLELGEAYARLGYYQRSVDVLESASQLTRDPELKANTERRISEIKDRVMADSAGSSEASNV